ncbi:hypothetical protein BGW36DRAFT_428907 [Talaromyces proteolyticus]|uniref:SAP domain-containing protein n=1 Tax=Talaromyces proteolyticus TaxID=1131652 RepID=A0AAD4KKT9_9EURO|nr:uncharacterized protein BGW36DRAFT_428907 [Talaromyces proteolyticus]KAH8695014.1 hypothetical protein BGW36DRAFT_428907 [Talaromyces proteolyticus]
MSALCTESARKAIGAPPSIAEPVYEYFSGTQFSCRVAQAGSADLRDVSHGNTPFSDNVAHYLPLSTSKLTKNGTVGVHQPHTTQQPLSWWKAQCRFRGLAVSGTRETLQARIRKHGDMGMEVSLIEAFGTMKSDYKIANTKVFEKLWNSADNDTKVKLWSKGFLYENFVLSSAPKKKVFVIELREWSHQKIEQACRQIKIACETQKMQRHENGQCLVVVGRDELTQGLVVKKKEELKAVKAEAEDRSKQAKSNGQRSKGQRDVSGSFDFTVQNGIMRFVNRRSEQTENDYQDAHRNVYKDNYESYSEYRHHDNYQDDYHDCHDYCGDYIDDQKPEPWDDNSGYDNGNYPNGFSSLNSREFDYR